MAIGNDLQDALEKLLGANAVDIQIEDTEDIASIIEAIIKANENLSNSTDANDWDMMGKDIKKLQELIDKLKDANDKSKESTTGNVVNVNNVIENGIY